MNKDMIFKGLQGAVGNTPLLAISYTYKGRPGRVYAKAEYFNLSGSIKDRVAMHILKKAYESGEIRQGDLIIEPTSGNTGISFSAIGSKFCWRACANWFPVVFWFGFVLFVPAMIGAV